MNIILDDNYLVVVDKPAGLLVHPTLANEKETLVSWFIDKYPNVRNFDWPDATRPGIVHRLDKDTSGLIVMAKNPEMLIKLQTQFKNREIRKTYLALVFGKVEKEGKIEAAIERGEAGTQKVIDVSYSFNNKPVRPAITFYKPIKYYQYNNNDLTLLEVQPKTGRMHQIRIHLKYLSVPIIGDPLYNIKPSREISKKLNLDHQFLHAEKLEFTDPITKKNLKIESKLPNDLQNILEKLK
jgi:23S rRNA pseudouridine1911/1915/1917 synthase